MERRKLRPIPLAALTPADRRALEAIRQEFLDRTDDGDGGADWVRDGLPDSDIRWWPHEIHSWGWDDVDEYNRKAARILKKYEGGPRARSTASRSRRKWEGA